MKLQNRNVPFTKVPVYTNADHVEMRLLKDTLNRFRLVGPVSSAVIADALPVASVSAVLKRNADGEVMNQTWCHSYYKLPHNKACKDKQDQLWTQVAVKKPGEMPASCVV